MALSAYKSLWLTLRQPTLARPEKFQTQYLLGDSLLVAPVFEASGDVRYYVPEGRWVDFETGEAKGFSFLITVQDTNGK